MGTIKTKIEELIEDGGFSEERAVERIERNIKKFNWFDALDGCGPAEGDNDRGGKIAPAIKRVEEEDKCE